MTGKYLCGRAHRPVGTVGEHQMTIAHGARHRPHGQGPAIIGHIVRRFRGQQTVAEPVTDETAHHSPAVRAPSGSRPQERMIHQSRAYIN